MRLRDIQFLFLAGILAASFALPARGEDAKYLVKLDRSWAVGDSCQITSTVAIKCHWVAMSEGKEAVDQTWMKGFDFQAVCTVLAVNKEGRIIKSSCEIRRCVSSSGTDSTPVFPPGVVMTVETRDGKPFFQLKDGELTAEQKKDLSWLVRPRAVDGPSSDSMYGIAAAQPVGATWPVNAEQIAASYAKDDRKVDSKDIQGSTTLVKIDQISDRQCMELKTEMKISNLQAKPPAGFTSSVEDFSTIFTGMLPVDPTLCGMASTNESTQWHSKMKSVDAKGNPVDTLESMEIDREESASDYKAAPKP